MTPRTDAGAARGLTEPEGDARDLAAKLADARRLAESAARTVARLTRERDEARAQVAAVLAECDHSEWVIREASGVELAPPLVGVTTHRIRTAIADALGAPRG